MGSTGVVGWGTSRVCREYPREEEAVAVADRVVHPIDRAARAGEVHLQGALTGTHGYSDGSSRVLRWGPLAKEEEEGQWEVADAENAWLLLGLTALYIYKC